MVFFVKTHLAPDACVTESAMLIDRRTGEEREVDVLIEADVAGHTLRIGIECSDRKRPADVTWVET
ncbi:MAG: hypothetical protein ACJ72W_05800, partial [Actinoallomurus sp.]